MADTFSYSILTAVPDDRRGERVNVGLAVLLPERLDVRLSGVAKLRALTGEGWEQHLTDAARTLMSIYRGGENPAEFSQRASLFGGAIGLSAPGRFSVETPDQYESRVEDILKALVDRPRPPARPKSNRINTEIARQFKRTKILATSAEDISGHKIVRDYVISPEEELTADFAAKNGVYYVVATLDLRLSTVGRKDACEKAIVLDKAKHLFGQEAKRIGVYAGVPSAKQYKPSIEVLRDYASLTFNWLDIEERGRYLELLRSAVTRPVGIFAQPN